MRVLTVENTRKLEAIANENGISYLQLMENAALFVRIEKWKMVIVS